jgi:hypothetical protein
VAGPEFKYQYCQKAKKEEREILHQMKACISSELCKAAFFILFH